MFNIYITFSVYIEHIHLSYKFSKNVMFDVYLGIFI